MEVYIKRAIDNIVKFGDTDIFPFPFERNMFEDMKPRIVDRLLDLHDNFDKFYSSVPPLSIDKVVPIGYYSFRYGKQIEPFWNAYYLACVLALADEIERKRINRDAAKVFSYRYKFDEANKSLFADLTWKDYKKQCVDNSRRFSYVLETDINNFYPRVNHHKLENELNRIDSSRVYSRSILKLLSSFTGTISHGLPVGGPAPRILSELALCQSDDHLSSGLSRV